MQQSEPFIFIKPLRGSVEVKYSSITYNSWFNNEYQRNTEEYLNQSFGFRNFLVRLNNQICFLLFNKANAKVVIVGKENYLYEQGYIDAINGVFYVGRGALNDTINKIKMLQTELQNSGRNLLIVLAPSKARIYPEYIPESYLEKTKKETYYDFYKSALKNAGINFIDFNSIFLEKRNKSKFLLFPQLGVHWSRLEAVLAADTIFKHLSFLGKCNLPNVEITSVEEKLELEPPDDDMIQGMNLLEWPAYKKMAYPTVVVNSKGKDQKNCIVISDSFWWDIYSRQLPSKVFKNNEFWYYLKEVRGSNILNKKNISDIDIQRHLLQTDFVVIVCTESNLSRMGFGFFQNALNALNKPKVPTKEELLEIKEFIRNDNVWLQDVKNKSHLRRISIDSMITLDALWFFKERGPIIKGITFQEVLSSVYSNPEWMESIRIKANEQKISVDSMAKLDAAWHMLNELNIPEKAKNHITIPMIKDMIQKDKVWSKQIQIKSKRNKVSVDSMMTLDAIWFLKELN